MAAFRVPASGICGTSGLICLRQRSMRKNRYEDWMMDMADRPEKLTEVLSVKIDDTRLRLLRGSAEAEGIEAPELVRNLIDSHLETQRQKHAALDRIFGALNKNPKENRG